MKHRSNAYIAALAFAGALACGTESPGTMEDASVGGTDGATGDVCSDVLCSQHGECAIVAGEARCLCEEGFGAEGLECLAIDPRSTCTDPSCAPSPCDNVSCSGHGRCVEQSAGAFCECDSGFVRDGLECVAQASTAPRIIRFDSNVSSIVDGDDVTFTAIVTDPDGIDDLIGGTLEHPVTGASYGAFVTSAQEGAYEISISWDDIHRVESIVTPAGGIDRLFQAVFYDQAGDAATASLVVHLGCSSPAAAVCPRIGDSSRTVCANLMTSRDYCGDCFTRVLGDAVNGCYEGVPGCQNSNPAVCNDECVNLDHDMRHCGACDARLSISMGTCEDGVHECFEPIYECNERCMVPRDAVAQCNDCRQNCDRIRQSNGYLEFFLDGRWLPFDNELIPVNHQTFDALDADRACEFMGYTSAMMTMRDGGPDVETINLICSGSHATLLDCDMIVRHETSRVLVKCE